MQNLTIAGNVGRDAELRSTQGGDKVLNFSVAVDNGKDKDGQKRQPTWFDCSLWGKRAESLEPFIKKGSKLVVSGRPTAREYQGKAYLGVNVSELTFMGGGSNEGGGGSSGGYGGSRDDGPRSGSYDQSPGDGQQYGEQGDLDGEIPF